MLQEEEGSVSRGGSGHSSQGIGSAGGSDTGGSQRSSASLETQEMLMLLRRLGADSCGGILLQEEEGSVSPRW